MLILKAVNWAGVGASQNKSTIERPSEGIEMGAFEQGCRTWDCRTCFQW